MKEYIERETILKTPPFTKCVGDLSEYAEGYLDCVEDACEAVNNVPAADVAPVRHGEWIKHTEKGIWTGKPTSWYRCSLCGRAEDMKEPYCNCGARMDGGNR